MNGKKPNRDEAAWLDAVTQLGCIVCLEHYHLFSPCEVHHTNGGGNHLDAYGLCDRHHRHPGEGYATRHGNYAEFKRLYGSDETLLELTRERLGYV